MSTLREELEAYLVLRRALGFQLVELERQVGLFITWLEAKGQEQTFTIEEVLAWARLNPEAHPSWWATRLSLVRQFAAYLHANGVSVPVIPTGLLQSRKPRAVPYIYSQQDLDALLSACSKVFSEQLTARTVYLIIGLLAATGLRIGEVLNLLVDEINAADQVLVVNPGKSEQRLVPIDQTTVTELQEYLALPARRATLPDHHGPVFVSSKGTGLVYNSFYPRFKQVRQAAGLKPRGRARPRIHDLRHSFATLHLCAPYAHDGDPERVLTLLATYLGHSDPAHTYWYLSATSELMSQAAKMLDTAPREGELP